MKKDWLSGASRAALAVLIYAGGSQLVSLLFALILNLIRGDGFSLLLVTPLSDAAGMFADSVIVIISMGAAIIFGFSGRPATEYAQPTRPFSGFAPQLFFAGIWLTSVLTTLSMSAFGKLGLSWPDALLGAFWENKLTLVATVLRYALLPAILEELLFRGAVMGALRPYGERAAILVSALFFMFMHYSADRWAGIYMLGIIFAYIDIKTESIIPSTVMHLINNAASLYVEYLTVTGNTDRLGLISGIMIGLGVTGGLIFLSYVSRPGIRELARLKPGEQKGSLAVLNIPALVIALYGVLIAALTAVKA